MSEFTGRHDAWLHQAEEDFRWGQDSLTCGHFAQACFIAQQVGEKALKALAFYRNFDLVKSHSIARIAEELQIDGGVHEMASALDLYYISARYPDALPGCIAPSDHFTRQMAETALSYAQKIIERVRSEMIP
jgi:HEPN domain-containing protein